MPPAPPRLIDLHSDWLLQYAPETTLFDPALAPPIAGRWDRVEGYLGAAAAAIQWVSPAAADPRRQPDPWAALDDLIARLEAEFPGRLLRDPADLVLWQADTSGLAWGVLGVEGFEALIRTTADLERLPALWDRGLRAFAPGRLLDGPTGSDADGLGDLGTELLRRLSELATPASSKLLIDLADLRPATVAAALDWIEADADRPRRMIPIVSHGTPQHAGGEAAGGFEWEAVKRLRALGGAFGLDVGPPAHDSAETLRASIAALAEIPFLGRAGVEGIGFGTAFLARDRTAPGLGSAPELIAWALASFDAPTAAALVEGNGRALLERMLSVG